MTENNNSATTAVTTTNHIIIIDNNDDNNETTRNNVTVKFITIDGQVYTQSFDANVTILDLKSHLMNVFHVPTTIIMLKLLLPSSNDDIELDDELILNDIKQDNYGIIELQLQSSNSHYTISAGYAYRDFTVPDVITVRLKKVNDDDNTINDVVVEIENRAIVKPFLGGYYDQTSGLEYHHGYSQTGPRISNISRSHRDTQTYFMRNRKLDGQYSQATQMTTTASIWIPNVTDRIIKAQPYETAAEREKRLDIEGKVRIIQRYYRIWKLKKMLKLLSIEYHKRLQLELDREAFELNEDRKRRKYDLVSRIFPQSSRDFAMLHAMTEHWKLDEIKRIESMTCGPAKIAEFYLLLDKELAILRSIESLYQQIECDRKIRKDEQFFHRISTPVKWTSDYKQLKISMDTLETQQGRCYYQLFKSFSERTSLDKTSHIQVLLDIKATLINDNYCRLSSDLIQLIDRVCELLARGFNCKQLDMLEKRIEAYLLKHYQTTECNNGVTDRYQHQLEKYMMKKNLIYCKYCNNLKTIDAFNITTNSMIHHDKISCRKCHSIDKSTSPWIDVSPYHFILRQIRRYEQLHQGNSSIIFLMQDNDIYYLINTIWHSHSAISESNDIYQLRMCRWLRHQDWTPWNCILLTVDEVKSHLKIDNLESFYEQEFLNDIRNKHALSKQYFANGIVMMDKIAGTFPDCPPDKEQPEQCLCD